MGRNWEYYTECTTLNLFFPFINLLLEGVYLNSYLNYRYYPLIIRRLGCYFVSIDLHPLTVSPSLPLAYSLLRLLISHFVTVDPHIGRYLMEFDSEAFFPKVVDPLNSCYDE